MRLPLLAVTSLVLVRVCFGQTYSGVASAVVVPAVTAPAAEGRITGHVLCDDTRRPARGAMVLAERLPSEKGTDGGGTAMFGGNTAHVRSDGSYTLEHLPPGDYTVLAFLPGYLSRTEDLISAEKRQSSEEKRAALAKNGLVAVRGPATANFDVTLQHGAAISGRVLYADGAPAASVTLVVEDAKAKPTKANTNAEDQMAQAFFTHMFTQQSMSTDDEGRFRLSGLPSGTYRLAVAQPTSASEIGEEGMGFLLGGVADPHALRFYSGDTIHRNKAKTYELQAGDDITGVDITVPIDAFHEVRGTVNAKDGRTINMGEITLIDASDEDVVLHAAVHRDGTFTLQQVPAGSFNLSVGNPRIGSVAPNAPAAMADRWPLQPTAAFGDISTALIVQDGDVDGVSLTVSPTPMTAPPQPSTSVPDEP